MTTVTAAEIRNNPACADALAARDCDALAAILSVGRTQYVTTMITERGVRAALSVPAASQFIRLLKACAEATATPEWLAATLTAVGVAPALHQDYFDAIASAYGWLRQGAGIDIGSASARGMLDIIAASDPAKFGATSATLKALASVPHPYTPLEIAEILYNPNGTDK